MFTTKVNGKMECDGVRGNKCGQMDLYMKATLSEIWQMDRED